MNIIEHIEYALQEHLMNLGLLTPEKRHVCSCEIITDEQKQSFGDLSTTVALMLAKERKENPRALAQQIATSFIHSHVEKMEVAGPGFINLFLKADAFVTLAQEIFTQNETFFKPSQPITQHRISLEFVSANPTGPLHFGNGRGGIIGDVLANIFTFIGHHVTKEYYINDAGVQIKKLGASFKARYLQLIGIDAQLPEDGYYGDYLIEAAQSCLTTHGKELSDKPDSFFEDYAKIYILAQIKQTLHDYGIHFDVWFSEKTLHENGDITRAIERLKERGYIYEKDDAVWFASSQFGDDKDRVIQKGSGDLTYVAADIAYLENKIERGNDRLILILGHDHHSYAVRLKAARDALGFSHIPFDCILYQLVNIKENGQQVRMSKRSGTVVALQDIIDTVGKDVTRFFYLNRKAEAPLDFDLNLALSKTDENPVYYIQYAYVRTHSILEKINQESPLQGIMDADAPGLGTQEAFLIKKIVSLKQLLISISNNNQTHTLAYFSHELAQVFSRYYSKNRIIDLDDIKRSRARLMVTIITQNTLGLCLKLMGISQPKRM